MTDFHWLAIAVFFSISPLTGALIYLAHRVRGVVSVNVTQPPITVTQPPITVHQPDITVQAPTAIIPEHVTDILRRIEEKLEPVTATFDDAELDALVKEAVDVAEASSMRGFDKFRIAREFIFKRAEVMNVRLDDRDVALRIEAAVVALNRAKAQATP